MTDVKSLSNDQLVQGLKKCVRVELENSAEMVAFIEEVERRRLYFDFGRDSLFTFLTLDMGLPKASAQLRIDSARLMRVVPEIREDLSKGTLHMSQLASIAKAVRQKKKESGRNVSVEEKRNLVEKVRHKTDSREIQKVLSQALDLKIQVQESARTQKDESVFLEMRLSKEQMAVIEHAKGLLAHVDPNPSWSELFVLLAERCGKQKDPARERRPVRQTSGSGPEPMAQPSGRYVCASDRRALFQRVKCCQWKTDGKICGSTFQLQPDHIQPVWAGGSNELANLQLLCAAHNREKYRREAGIRPKK